MGSSGVTIPDYEIKTKYGNMLVFINMLRMLKNSENVLTEQHECIKKIYNSSDKEQVDKNIHDDYKNKQFLNDFEDDLKKIKPKGADQQDIGIYSPETKKGESQLQSIILQNVIDEVISKTTFDEAKKIVLVIGHYFFYAGDTSALVQHSNLQKKYLGSKAAFDKLKRKDDKDSEPDNLPADEIKKKLNTSDNKYPKFYEKTECCGSAVQPVQIYATDGDKKIVFSYNGQDWYKAVYEGFSGDCTYTCKKTDTKEIEKFTHDFILYEKCK